ncbi:MAG TPA: hypothetical protein PLR88_06325 [Bacteroidales bacterium]|nr:hypothetical protein [Bacteroidales bacterium]HPT21545.1 hypothetical protein [Bacteroidales bacterium]
MKRVILTIALFSLLCQAVWCQRSYSDKQVTSGNDIFLPFHRGEVIRRDDGSPQAIKSVAAAILTCDSLRAPRGFDVTCYTSESYMSVSLEPYMVVDGDIDAWQGAELEMYFNDVTHMFHQSLIPGIYSAPAKKGKFMGYDIYDNGVYEVSVIKNDPAPLFLPVTREEFLKALIEREEKNRDAGKPEVTPEQSKKEMEDAYQLLLKTDREAAEEFKAAMNEYTTDISRIDNSFDMVSRLRGELERLTPEERVSQAYYYVGAMEENGSLSGLADSSMEYTEPLVRPNKKFMGKSTSAINLIIIHWTLGSVGDNRSVARLYKYTSEPGYTLTDNKLLDLHNDRKVWGRIFELVR